MNQLTKLPIEKTALDTGVAADPPNPTVLAELRGLIEQARTHLASTVNSAQTLLYWQVGERINREVLKDERADYGEQIVSTLSTQLVQAYGQSFGLRSLRRMVQFSEAFPDANIVATLSRQLSWSHFIAVALARERHAVLTNDTHPTTQSKQTKQGTP
jgi:hypothetical protein